MNIQTLISTLQNELPSTGITCYPAADEQLIQQLEAELNLTLPSDFKDFYAFCNGFESEEEFFRIIPLEEIIQFKKDYKPNQAIFAEFGILCDYWTVEITLGGSYQIIGFAPPNGLKVVLTDSLSLFVQRFLQGGVFEKGGLVDWIDELSNQSLPL